MNFGVVGLGWPGLMHAEAVLKTRGARLHTVVDASADRVKAFLKNHPARHVQTDYLAMLKDPEVEAVIVCLPNFLHYPVSLAALKAGRHVLCEKPPTLNAREMRRLQIEAEQRRLTYAFGRQSRFAGTVTAARKIVRAGKLGKIYHVKTSWFRRRGIPIGIGGWFLDKTRAGGGALIDIGIHALDNAWFLVGSPRPVAVSACVSQNFSHLVPSNIVNTVDDSGFAFIRFETGLVISLETTWAANLPENLAEGWNGTAQCLLLGTKAGLHLDIAQGIKLCTGAGNEIVESQVVAETTDRFQLQLKDFMAAVRTGNPPLSNAKQAVQLMQMLDAIYRSSAAGREVRIGE